MQINSISFEAMRVQSAYTRKPVAIDQDLEHQNHKSKILEEDRRQFLRQA